MAEEKKGQILKKIIGSLIGRDLTKTIDNYLRQRVLRLMRLVGVVVVGLAFLSLGLIFILYGLVQYLSFFMPAWMAFEIIGLIGVLIGVLAVLISWILK